MDKRRGREDRISSGSRVGILDVRHSTFKEFYFIKKTYIVICVVKGMVCNAGRPPARPSSGPGALLPTLSICLP
jgi:hypothetical protein